MLVKYVPQGQILCPVAHHVLNGDDATVHVWIVVNPKGRIERLTMPVDVFNELPEAEVTYE